MRAKFSAQIETGVAAFNKTSAPAATTRPARVNINGKPAATTLPNARIKTASVTGHDNISDFIIAE
jgi:hypothetical protein